MGKKLQLVRNDSPNAESIMTRVETQVVPMAPVESQWTPLSAALQAIHWQQDDNRRNRKLAQQGPRAGQPLQGCHRARVQSFVAKACKLFYETAGDEIAALLEAEELRSDPRGRYLYEPDPNFTPGNYGKAPSKSDQRFNEIANYRKVA